MTTVGDTPRGPREPDLRLRMALDPVRLCRVRARVRDYLLRACGPGDHIDDIVLCIDEACSNVIRHSGAGDDAELSLHLADGVLTAVVRDTGVGFDEELLTNRAAPPDDEPGGRGLLVIRGLMDEVEVSFDGGVELRMRKRVPTGKG